MITPIFLRHGERCESPCAEFGTAEGGPESEHLPDAENDSENLRYRKSSRASASPRTFQWIKSIYSDAIEYTAVTKELRGLPFFWAVFGGIGIGSCIVAIGVFFTTMGGFDDLFPLILGALTAIGGLIFSVYVAVLMLRTDLFRPSDLPIVFHRGTRKVYRLVRDMPAGWRGLFQAWPVYACEYEWDLVDAEHQKQAFTTGASVHTNHFMAFVVRRSAIDPSIIDSFHIGNANVLDGESVANMWEHIRRFMEESGPHLPSSDEQLADTAPTQSWWESMSEVGPFGSGYLRNWRDRPLYMVFVHLFSPFFVPLFLLWGTGNYLSYRTEVDYGWPDEVLKALGPARQRC